MRVKSKFIKVIKHGKSNVNEKFALSSFKKTGEKSLNNLLEKQNFPAIKTFQTCLDHITWFKIV